MIQLEIHTIEEIPSNPSMSYTFIGVLRELSIFPQFMTIQDYLKDRDELMKTEDSKGKDRGYLIGWFYATDLLPKEERLRLISVAAKSVFYKNLWK